ncbi:CoA ester lyase [Nonomuraea sp. NPDC003804]|uniref:HpcH/HpaI aldolase/citrate lyase family protein n=1 Tax=Nonomuraea sp. NPDC003804 TaxID=3154547 RepID=UPI0033B6C1C5
MTLTWLYVPGDRPERFDKAMASGADVVIVDLEDAVAPSRKDAARRNVVDFLRAGPSSPRARADGAAGDRGGPGAGARAGDSTGERGAPAVGARVDGAGWDPGGPSVHVRVNDPATDHGRRDLRALAGLPLAAVRVPKVHSVATLDLVDLDVPVHALLESAAGVVNAAAIAAHPRVAGVALGEQDLMAELSITDEAALDHLRVQAVLAAAAAGLPPVAMSVYADVADEAGLLASTRRGRALGLYGRAAIHPRQLPVIREAFTPTPEEVARAREIVAAAELAGDVGAVALPDGRFVDAPVVARARRTLGLADRLAR